MLEFVTIYNKENWNKTISRFNRADSYYSINYVTPFKENGDGEPILIYYNHDNLEMINVVIKRDIAKINVFKDILEENKYFDFITPYGYGGMLVQGDITKSNLNKMLIEYNNWCIKNNIITEFVRFHPLINHKEEVYNFFNKEVLGPTITVELTNYNDIWINYLSTNRNMIRKATKNNVVVEYGYNLKYYNHFVKLYLETMKNIKSDNYYLFSDKFYKSFYKQMKNRAIVFNAIYNNEVIASSLILFDKGNVHYHLSGSNYDYRNLSATNLILDEVIKYSIDKGYKSFHLGGGLGSKEDSLYKFKKNFNPKSNTIFKIGKKIYNINVYNELISFKDSDENKNDYFPLYRK